jgi:hypothetical protein
MGGRERFDIAAAALAEVGVRAKVKEKDGVFLLTVPSSTDPKLVHRALSVARASVGMPPRDLEDWAEYIVRQFPDRRRKFIRAGALPEGWSA